MKKELLHWLVGHKVGSNIMEYKDQQFEYWIVDAAINGLQEFVGFPEGEILFISINVPEICRVPFLTHEIAEFSDPAIRDSEERCLLATKIELNRVPEVEKHGYIYYRFVFLDTLINCSKGHESEDFIRRLTASRDYLASLIPIRAYL